MEGIPHPMSTEGSALAPQLAQGASAIEAISVEEETRLSIAVLAAHDEKRLAHAMKSGVIRLLSVKALLAQQPARLLRLQELPPTLFLNAEQAHDLLLISQRRVLVLSHCWPMRGDPDPTGRKWDILLDFLKAFIAQLATDDYGLFVDFCCLPQSPRSAAEQAIFGQALNSMGDLYASAVGTCVLQLKLVPDLGPDVPEPNLRSYEERGWTTFEDAAARECVGRAYRFARVKQALDQLPVQKLYLIDPDASSSVQPVEIRAPQDRNDVLRRLERVVFTGMADRAKVQALYSDYANEMNVLFQKADPTLPSYLGATRPVTLHDYAYQREAGHPSIATSHAKSDARTSDDYDGFGADLREVERLVLEEAEAVGGLRAAADKFYEATCMDEVSVDALQMAVVAWGLAFPMAVEPNPSAAVSSTLIEEYRSLLRMCEDAAGASMRQAVHAYIVDAIARHGA